MAPKRRRDLEADSPNTRLKTNSLTGDFSEVTANESSKIDKFLRASFPAVVSSPKDVGHLIKLGLVSINGTILKKQMVTVKPGDRVTLVHPSTALSAEAKLAETLGVKVHWENNNLAIVWKPSGVLISGSSKNSLAALVPAICSNVTECKFLTSLNTSTAGLVLCCKSKALFDSLDDMHGNGLISETWTVVVQGHVGNIRSLASHETFEIDSEIDGVLGAVSLVTFLEASRTRNFCSKGGSWLSLCLVSPLQGSRPVPFQALRHLETSLHPVLEGDSLALTGLDFEFAGKTVSVTLDIPKKLKNLLKREQEAWTGQRAQNLEQLKKAGIEASASILDSLDSGTPISYILGKHRFYGLDFIVSPAVMIPKPGTEVLLQSVIQKTHSLRGAEGSGGVRRNPHVLDLGTGSGCILVSLLQSPHLKNSRGLGIDLSKDALEIAKQNAAKHGLITTTNSNRIIFGETSFEGLPKYLETEYSKAVKEPFDYIVTNPPYLEAKLWESDRLYSSQKHEPRIALVGGDDGLEAYRQIYRALSKTSEIGYLCKGSVLFVEVNNGELAKKVETLFCGSANVIRDDDKLSEGWRFIRVDVDGKGIERCVVFEWK